MDATHLLFFLSFFLFSSFYLTSPVHEDNPTLLSSSVFPAIRIGSLWTDHLTAGEPIVD